MTPAPWEQKTESGVFQGHAPGHRRIARLRFRHFGIARSAKIHSRAALCRVCMPQAHACSRAWRRRVQCRRMRSFRRRRLLRARKNCRPCRECRLLLCRGFHAGVQVGTSRRAPTGCFARTSIPAVRRDRLPVGNRRPRYGAGSPAPQRGSASYPLSVNPSAHRDEFFRGDAPAQAFEYPDRVN